MIIPISVVIVFCQLILSINASQRLVSLFVNVNQLVTSSTLTWQAYSGDERDLEFGVQSSRYTSPSENYTMYVCRAIVDGIIVPGHTQKHGQRTVCIVSLHMDVRTHHTFDVLLNKHNGARIEWKSWDKYVPVIPTGAVSAVSAGHVRIKIFIIFGVFM